MQTYREVRDVINQVRNIFENVATLAGDDFGLGVVGNCHRVPEAVLSGRTGTGTGTGAGAERNGGGEVAGVISSRRVRAGRVEAAEPGP